MVKRRKHGSVVRFESCHPDKSLSLVNTQFARLLNSNISDGVTTGVSKLYIPDRVMALPYTLPRLIIPKPTSKDQRWLIKYYVWNADIGKVVMVRDYTCNSKKDFTQRRLYAGQLIDEISKKLIRGQHINTAKLMAQQQANQIQVSRSFKEAMELAMYFKRAENIKSIRNYENCYRKLTAWLAKVSLQKHTYRNR